MSRWIPGQSGNPAGRPRKDPDLVEQSRQVTSTVVEFWRRCLMRANEQLNADEPNRVLLRAGERAADRLMAYAWGRPNTAPDAEIMRRNAELDTKHVTVNLIVDGEAQPIDG